MHAAVTPATECFGRPIRLFARDGLQLQMESFGRDDAPPVLFCHGFGQSRGAWRSTAGKLASEGFRCLSVDMRGHGDSDRRHDGDYTFEQFADDLVDAARHLGTKPVLVGASMGGLLGLVAEAELGPLFRAMVLVDVTPRWEAQGVGRIIDFMRSHRQGFANQAEAAAAIAAYLPHRSAQQRQGSRLNEVLVRGPDGRLHWHWDPALIDRIAVGADAHQPRLLAATSRIRIPMLLVSGGISDVVSDETIAEFLTLAPHAEHVRIDHAAHMVAGDDNIAFANELGRFLQRLA